MHSPNIAGGVAPPATLSPLHRFLIQCHAEFQSDYSGAVADYIPELKKADPAHFGVSLATIDGHVYEVGDSAVPFTIQSISKAFVFALALEMLGAERGGGGHRRRAERRCVQFDPAAPRQSAVQSDGQFRRHRLLRPDPQGAGSEAFECIRDALGRFAGRKLDVDEAVFASERETGDRNRAIAYLLRNYSISKATSARCSMSISASARFSSPRAISPSWRRRSPTTASIRSPASR